MTPVSTDLSAPQGALQSRTLHEPLIIRGGTPLRGELQVQGSKNAALPMIVASLLTDEPVVLRGVPRLSDVQVILDLAAHLGTRYEWQPGGALALQTPELVSTHAPYSLVSKMRASFILLGAILGRAGHAEVSMPGGCAFGHRPVDQHVQALRALGADVQEEGGHFVAQRATPLSGRFIFDLLTVGGTHNAMLAAVLGHGNVTVLENASIDTDVIELARLLRLMGAQIEGEGTHTITITGVPRLGAADTHVIPDRIEAGTWMMAAAATRGRVTLRGVRADHLRAVSAKLSEMNVLVQEHANERGDGTVDLSVNAEGRRLKGSNVTTQSYPGFPTDLQPQISALLATLPGTQTVSDPIYPERTTHVAELRRMGADITVSGQAQVIGAQGGQRLMGAPVKAADLRAGAALMIAALAAQGETQIHGTIYLERGYDHLMARLAALDADAVSGQDRTPRAQARHEQLRSDQALTPTEAAPEITVQPVVAAH